MALTFPRDLVLEMYFPGQGWVDVTAFLRQTSPVTVTRGRRGEQERPAPSTLTCVLDDRTGNMTPSNPMGLYFGKLGQFTPTRLSLRYGIDQLNRVSSNGWSDSPADGPWTTNGGAAGDYAIDGTRGTHATSGTSQKRRTWLANTSNLRNYEVRVKLPSMATLPNGTSVYQSLMMRGTSATKYLAVDCRLDSTETVNLAIRGSDDNTFTVPAFSVGTRTNGHTWILAAQVDGQTVRGKLWDATAGGEPYDWQASYVDDGVLVTAADPTGWTGVRTSSASNSAPWTYYYDDFEIRIPLFFGEAAEFKPQWDTTHKIRTVTFKAADLTQRMGKAAKRRAHSAIQRYVEQNATQPLAYWRMNDGQLAVTAQAYGTARPDPATMVFTQTARGAPGRPFGTGNAAPWINPVAETDHEVQPGGVLYPPTGTVDWSAHFALTIHDLFTSGLTGPPSPGLITSNDSFAVFNSHILTGFDDQRRTTWSLTFYNDAANFTGRVQFALAQGSPVTNTVVADVATNVPFDRSMHHLGFRVAQNGANVDWWVYLDGAVLTFGTLAGKTNYTPDEWSWTQNLGSDGFGNDDTGGKHSRSLGHVIIYSGAGPSVAAVSDAILGHPGETAGNRAKRICAEEGIPFTWIGPGSPPSGTDLDATQAMGPQFQDTVLEVLQECAATERATLVAARGAPGFVFRTRAGITQPARVTLDYAAGQVAPEFKPATDDKDVRNLITVRRRSGGEVTAEQVTGPMNTGDPGGSDPDAAAENDARIDVNTASESQLAGIAQHELARGTVPGDRYPKVTVNLRAPGVTAAVHAAVLCADVDERVVVQNAAAALIFDSLDQVGRGYTHVFKDAFEHLVTFDTVPYSPYRVFILGTDRLDTDTSTLAAGVAAGLALPYTISVATTGLSLWTTDPAQFPLDVVVAGQRLTISAISGASSPQTFTVSARANGVDKQQLAGAKVSLADPAVLG